MEGQSGTPRRWDPIVKLTHWGVVTAVIANAIFTEEGSGWHIWVGYGLAGLLALRLLWGLIGPAEARFSAFPPSPARAVAHLAEIRRGEVVRHRSHNPLGALMAYAIWGTLLVIVGSGIAMSGPPPADPAAVQGEAGEGREGQRPEHEEEREEGRELSAKLPGKVLGLVIPPAHAEEAEGGGGEGKGDELFEEVHEIAVNLLYLLIALHMAGVIFETRRLGHEIVGAMIPGGNRRT
jgi:cytochrome b